METQYERIVDAHMRTCSKCRRLEYRLGLNRVQGLAFEVQNEANEVEAWGQLDTECGQCGRHAEVPMASPLGDAVSVTYVWHGQHVRG